MQRLAVLLGIFVFACVGVLVWLRMHDSGAIVDPPRMVAAPVIVKQPPVVATRRFDPANPPNTMPPIHPGEAAVTDSNFGSGAVVTSQRRGAMVTITNVRMTLQLSITIWVPDAVTEKVLQHEEGHRQIAEAFYANADKIAYAVAADYIGRELDVPGGPAAADAALQKISEEINTEYDRRLDVNRAQLRFDEVTDHARNQVSSSDAVAQVLSEQSIR